MTFIILACALPQYNAWWPFFVVLFYLLAPLPTMIARRTSDGSGTSCSLEVAIFITMGIVISSFGLPIVMARAPVAAPTIQWGACYLTLGANVIIYLIMLGFYMKFDDDDQGYGMW